MHRAAVPFTAGVTPGEMGKHLSEGYSPAEGTAAAQGQS